MCLQNLYLDSGLRSWNPQDPLWVETFFVQKWQQLQGEHKKKNEWETKSQPEVAATHLFFSCITDKLTMLALQQFSFICWIYIKAQQFKSYTYDLSSHRLQEKWDWCVGLYFLVVLQHRGQGNPIQTAFCKRSESHSTGRRWGWGGAVHNHLIKYYRTRWVANRPV